MENMFLMLYQVLGSLGAKGGPWGAEMYVKYLPKGENLQDWTQPRSKESVLGCFLCNEGYGIHGEDTLEVLLSGGVTGSKGWSMGC